MPALRGRPSRVAACGARETAARTLTGLGLSPRRSSLLFLVFTRVAGDLASLCMSVTDITTRDLQTPFGVNFVGLDNYARLLQRPASFRAPPQHRRLRRRRRAADDRSWRWPSPSALNTGIIRLSGLFRVGYYVPVVTSIVAIAVVWRFLLAAGAGWSNELLSWFGIQGPELAGRTHLGARRRSS